MLTGDCQLAARTSAAQVPAVTSPPLSSVSTMPPSTASAATMLRASSALMDVEPPRNSRQQRQQAAAAADKAKQTERTQPTVRQTEGRRSAGEATGEVNESKAANTATAAVAASNQAAADGFRTKPTGLRPAPATDIRTNVPSRSANRSNHTDATLDRAPNSGREKENAAVVRGQSVEGKPHTPVKPALEERTKVDKPRPITVLVTNAAMQLPNAAELVKQLAGELVSECKGAKVTHCVVGNFAATEKVSSCAHLLAC